MPISTGTVFSQTDEDILSNCTVGLIVFGFYLGIVDSGMVGTLNQKQQDLVHRSYRRAMKCMAFITSLLKLTRMKLTGQLEMGNLSLRKSVFNAITAV